jgi:FKBP-type peptidyl-prolyl cis-trans isomerase 2
MKKALVILAVTPLILTSCLGNSDDKKQPSTPASGEVSIPVAMKTVVSKGDTVGVDYVGTLEDGTVFDSSIEEFAKKTKNYKPDSGRKYEPLSFTVGAGQMIKGFDEGVVGMKLGEKKTLILAPKDAYGEALTEQEVPAKYFQDIFSETVPRDNFKDVVTQTVPMSALGEKGKDLTVGKVIEAGNVKAKVTKIEGDNVTVDIDNTQNPFYGKKLAVGLKATFEGNQVTVKKLTDTEVTLDVVNKANPFYGKKIKEGME